MTRFSLILGITLLAFSASSMAEKFYKWVDENGVTHYGAQPPQDQQASEVNTRANASSSQEKEIEALNERRQAAKQLREAQEAKAEEAKRLAERPDEVNQERCDQHRKNLEILTNKPTVRQKNPETGEEEVITQEVREKMMSEARDALEKCDKL
ncbi:MAG: DUF4124 domain-containing protein [Alcanivorax nanhaiticus]